jgi:long-subunit fatty acid transport protein
MLAAQPAAASPLEEPLIAGAAVFTGPTRSHGSAIYLNPSALGIAQRGQHVLVMSGLRVAQINIDRNLIDSTGDLSAGPEVNDITHSFSWLASWDFLIADRYRFGLSFHTPFAEQYPDDDALRYHTTGGRAAQRTLSAAASATINSRLHIGFGISLGESSLTLGYARDTALDGGSAGINSDCGGAPCGLENPEAAERHDISVDSGSLLGTSLFQSKNVGLTGGVLIGVTKKWWLALSYVSPPGTITDLDLGGRAKVTRAPRDGGQTLEGNAEITYRLPQSVYIGTRGPLFPDHELVATIRWQNLSRHNRYDIRLYGGDFEEQNLLNWEIRQRPFQDVYSIDAGIESSELRRFRYGTRLRFETSALAAEDTTPIQMGGLNVALSAGAELRLGNNVVVGANYGLSYFPTVDASNSSFSPLDRIACVDSEFAYDQCTAAREGRAYPTASGSYSRLDHNIGLSIRYDSL